MAAITQAPSLPLLWKKIIQNMLRIWHDSVLRFSSPAISKITQGSKTTCIPIFKSTVGALFTPGYKIVARKQEKEKFLSTSAVNYLHSSVKPFFILSVTIILRIGTNKLRTVARWKWKTSIRIYFLGGPIELKGSRDKKDLFRLLQFFTSIPL